MQGRLERRAQLEREKAWVTSVLSQAQLQGFYGTLTIQLDKGSLVRVVKEESLKMPHELG